MTLPITISDLKLRESGTLRAFLTASLPSGIMLHELSVHTRDGKWWIGFPAKPVLIDGTVQRDESGKVRYGAPLVSFTSRQTRDRLSQAVVDALRRSHPEVFDPDGTL